ncbi:MAG: PEGA domain-containing protein [Myxococcota bacterium]
MRHSIRAVFVALALFVAAPAAGQSDADRDKARALVEEGLRHARSGEYEEAAEAFEQAFKLYPHPEILHNLARAREELGELSNAWTLFRRALDMDPDYTFAEDARTRIGDIEEKLKETHGLLKIRSTPSQIEVSVLRDGDALARHRATPVDLWVPEGDVELRGQKRGFRDAEVEVEVDAGEEEEVEMILRPVPKKGFFAVTAGGVPGAKVLLNGEEVGVTPLSGLPWPSGSHELRVESPGYAAHEEVVVVEPDQETSVAVELKPLEGEEARAARQAAAADGSNRGLAGGILVGGGGAALVAGALLHVSAYKKAQDAGDVPNIPGTLDDDERFDQLESEAERRQVGAFIGYGAAAVLVGVGTWLILSDDGEPPESTAGALEWTPTVGPTPDGFGMGATLRF